MPVSVISLRVGSRLHPYQPEQDIRLIDGQRDCHWWITILLRQTVGYRNARVELQPLGKIMEVRVSSVVHLVKGS